MRPIADNGQDPSQQGYFNNPHLSADPPSNDNTQQQTTAVGDDALQNSTTPIQQDDTPTDQKIDTTTEPLPYEASGLDPNEATYVLDEDVDIEKLSIPEDNTFVLDETSTNTDLDPIEDQESTPIDEIISPPTEDLSIEDENVYNLDAEPVAEEELVDVLDTTTSDLDEQSSPSPTSSITEEIDPLTTETATDASALSDDVASMSTITDDITPPPVESTVNSEQLTKADQIAQIERSLLASDELAANTSKDSDGNDDDDEPIPSMFGDTSDEAPGWHKALILVGVLLLMGALSTTGVFGFMVYDKMSDQPTQVPVSNTQPDQTVDEEIEEEPEVTNEQPATDDEPTEEPDSQIDKTEIFPDEKVFENKDLVVAYPGNWVLEEGSGVDESGILFTPPDNTDGSLLISYAPSTSLLGGEPDCSTGVDFSSANSTKLFRRVPSVSTEQFKRFLICESDDNGATYRFPSERAYYLEVNGRAESTYDTVDLIISNINFVSSQ